MLQPGLCVLFVFLSVLSPAVDGQMDRGEERIQVVFTPTVCKVRCTQGRCVNFCERGNVTTLYSSTAAGADDHPHTPGFRVCE